MQKKVIALLMSVLMLVSICGLTGCGGAKNTSNAFVVPETGFNTDESVEITFTHTMGAKLQEVLNTYIAEFNKIYPNIVITHQSAGGWGDINGQINTEIAGGNQPNIAYCYPDHVAMYNIAKSVVVLDNLIDSDIAIGDSGEIVGLTDEQKADFIESYYNEGLVYGDNMMYTMPLSKSTEVLYYDKTFFEANGLKVPTTWDEMWDTCAKIKALDPNCYPLGYDAEDNWFITLCEQMKSGYTSAENGGEYLFNNDQNKAFIKNLREQYQKGYFTTQELYGSYTSNLFVETTDTRCYMCVGSSGGASYQMSNNDTADGTFAFEVGVAPIPQYDESNRKVISQGPSMCILKGGKTTDQQVLASWLFVKFLCTNVEFQAEFSMASGYMPVINSVVENEAYANWLSTANGQENLVAQCVKVGIENRNDYFVSPAFKGSSTARVQVGNLLLKCMVDEAADDAAVDALIDSAFAEAIDECE